MLDITCGINYIAQLFSFPSDLTGSVLQTSAQFGSDGLFFAPNPEAILFYSRGPSHHLIHRQSGKKSFQSSH